MELESAKLVEAFDNCADKGQAVGDITNKCLHFLKSLKCDERKLELCHGLLSGAMIKAMKGGGKETSDLLNFAGPAQTLRVVYSNISQSIGPTAKWLSHEVLELLSSGGLTVLFNSQVQDTNTLHLSPAQEQLVGVVCRLPDCLANRLGRQLSRSLFPQQYFERVGNAIIECLKELCRLHARPQQMSTLFLAAVIGRASMLGQRESVLVSLISTLEDHVTQDSVWRCVSQALFSHIPTAGLEGVLETVIQTTTPSLLSPSPVHSMLGDLVLTNPKANFLLTHKLILIRVLSSQSAVYNLIGYLSVCTSSQCLLGKSLELALGVWSDGSALRHMDTKQHLWISEVIVLGVNCLGEKNMKNMRNTLQRLTMAGIEAHIESSLQQIRHVGMAVGEFLMNKFNPMDQSQSLKFEYETCEDVKVLQNLSRPVSEQQKNLESVGRREVGVVTGVEGDRGEESEGCTERFGEGMVKTVQCSDSDSDDDLPPYSMTDDPDSSAPRPPQYLRTLMKGLLTTKEPQKMEAALSVAESLIRSKPSDLHENSLFRLAWFSCNKNVLVGISQVSMELTKILLHLSDSYALPNFPSLRLKSLVALAVLSPQAVAPYLTEQFYAPNYNLRQRIDILEVIGTSALELSQPQSAPTNQSSGRGNDLGGRGKLRKQWEDVIDERLKAKTRIISKGQTRSPPKATPNRFADVAPLFFFPLMSDYDRSMATVNLLGEDSLVLGNLLYTLGTVMHAATHAVVAPAMGVALLDFLWALRYHSAAYVRQGVLFSLAMIFSATPPHTLLSQMDSGVTEAVQWMMGVAGEDADQQCRTLARYALTLFDSTVQQQVGDA